MTEKTKQQLELLKEAIEACLSLEACGNLREKTGAEKETYMQKYGDCDFVVGGFGVKCINPEACRPIWFCTPDMKFCKDCKHFDGNDLWHNRCRKSSYLDLVTGSAFVKDCSDVRRDETKCGRAARWFEPKEDKWYEQKM